MSARLGIRWVFLSGAEFVDCACHGFGLPCNPPRPGTPNLHSLSLRAKSG
ncbi:hypothetical protein NSU_4304 [Novosphingobium pentaromativorans US6-1]|uniref:Uncharacterized protein n=1 Tax=Novosphingobium pentaromativorans US6-1 TaxID=1088721 RepID=G6EIY3_9SPHN|nr:hypothetical protein NSU_4304 [Novosphingobium pentaromativorans US6-1]